jgi:hypothetical protein
MKKNKVLTLRSGGGSGSATPLSSAYPSQYPSEAEDEEEPSVNKPFKFLDLPSELRNKIYGFHFGNAPAVLDLDTDNFRNVWRKLSILFTNRQIMAEASHNFYSTHAVRLFPVNGKFFKAKKPLLARISPRCRASISTFELRLGPGFAAPPRGWIINDALGLEDCTRVRVIKVMVQVDPSTPIFKGFRNVEEGFYERFSQNLLEGVLMKVPSVTEVQFDAWPSVSRSSPIMQGLLATARKHGKMVSWGPEAGWKEEVDAEKQEAVLVPILRNLSISELAVCG